MVMSLRLRGNLSILAMLFATLSSPVEAAHNEVVKEAGRLLVEGSGFSLYLNGFGPDCQRNHFRGKQPEHWMYGSAFFDQGERLPIGDAFPTFFESVIWPEFSRVAPEECGTAEPALTRISVQFYFEGYEKAATFRWIAKGDAHRATPGEAWGFWSEGMATMAEVRGEEDVEAAREAAAEVNAPFGVARAWVDASKVPSAVHPPGLDAADLLLAGEALKVYTVREGGVDPCGPSAKARGDFFLHVAFRFAKDATLPLANRQQYADFFSSIFDRWLSKHCPGATVANIIHYMDEQSHPLYIDKAELNYITLRRDGTGSWQMVSPSKGEPIYASADEIDAARRSAVASRDTGARQAERDARLRKIAAALESGDFLSGIAELIGPRQGQIDALEEAALEDSGVFFAGDPEDDYFGHARLILCNVSGRAMRFASSIQQVPRDQGYEGAPPRTTIVSGWGRLDIDQCKTLRTGAASSAFLFIQQAERDGSFRTSLYSTDGRLESYSLDELSDLEREFRVLDSSIEFCVEYPSSFRFQSEGTQGVTEGCAPGAFLLNFPHFVQFPLHTKMTLQLQ